MHPILAYGAMALITYLLEQKTTELRTSAEREKRRLKDLKARGSRARRKARNRAHIAALAAANKMIGVLKAERRAALRARDRLPGESKEHEAAQELVVILSQRLAALYEKKAEFHTKQSR
jgi:hypothetical protein